MSEESEKRDKIRAIGELVRTQDNRITEEPIFLVEEDRRVYGVSSGFTDKFEEDEDGTMIGFVDIPKFVTVCFTAAAAQDYIERHRHDLTNPRIYVASGYDNPEWIAVRHHLIDRSEYCPPEDMMRKATGSLSRPRTEAEEQR